MDKLRILVSGGVGFIVSHVHKLQQQLLFIPVSFDDLVAGWRYAVKFGYFEPVYLKNKSPRRSNQPRERGLEFSVSFETEV